jgi:hypothetical protein
MQQIIWPVKSCSETFNPIQLVLLNTILSLLCEHIYYELQFK